MSLDTPAKNSASLRTVTFGLLGVCLCATSALSQSLNSGADQDLLRSEALTAVTTRADREGFYYGAQLSGVYDSNLFLDASGESDLQFVASPWIAYQNAPDGGALLVLSGRYAPFVRTYLENSSLNSLDHSGSASLKYDGSRASLSANAGYSRLSQANRFAAGRIDNEIFSVGAAGDYEISQLTSLNARASFGLSNQGLAETRTTTLELSGFWHATPLVRVGPTVRYSHRDGGNLNEVESTGLLLTTEYRASDLMQVRASGGVERASFTGGGDETGFTGSLSATYAAPDRPWSLDGEVRYGQVQQLTAANRAGAGGDAQVSGRFSLNYDLPELWSASLTAGYESLPSPATAGQSFDELSFGASVTRVLASGSLQGGVLLGFSDPEAPSALGPGGGGDFFSAHLGHRIRLWDDRISIDSTLRFSNNRGQRDWTRWQLSTGVSAAF